MAHLFSIDLYDVQPHQFTRLIERLLWHLGFQNVSNVDGSGDGGADIVATRANPSTGVIERWVFQAKSKKTVKVGAEAVEEINSGMQVYNAHHGVVVTNTTFSQDAKKRAEELKALGFRIGLWDVQQLERAFEHTECLVRFGQPQLRRYQLDAFEACWYDLTRSSSALAILATGLGKTVVAGSIIDKFLCENKISQVLVVADKIELVEQLERALWRHISKDIATQQVRGGLRPDILAGITVATVQSAIEYARAGYRPGLIFVDEAHHVSADGQFSELLALCKDALRLGATATPWRGDRFDISDVFGRPSVQIGIEEGMRLGYLADVDYRLFADNIDWHFVEQVSKHAYSIGELNRKLFLPQRDEQIRDRLLEVWYSTKMPKGIVFCSTVEHAERMLGILQGVPQWQRAACIHSGMGAVSRREAIAKFRLGDIPLLIAVDVLNEGVDVPDVNIVCFARVTHSRRIFIQQLGRGLRLREGKTHVSVLDFVSDLRRVKAVLDLKAKVQSEGQEVLVLPSSHSITFSDKQSESLFREWLFDIADLDTKADEVRLNFPPEQVV